MECEVCGKVIYGHAEKVTLDGARLYVCQSCANFTPSHRTYEIKKQPIQSIPRIPRPKKPQPRPRTREELIPDDLTLVTDYGKRIRDAREKKGFTHEELSRKIGERISLLQKVETEKMVPDRPLITKLEHALKVRLQEIASVQLDEVPKKRPIDLTLGDIMVLQKKKEHDLEESG